MAFHCIFHHMFFTTLTIQQYLFLEQHPHHPQLLYCNFYRNQDVQITNSHNEYEFEDDESANQQETEDNNFLVGRQNILNSLREPRQQPKKKKNTFDIELLIELVRRYTCIWKVKLSIQRYFEKTISLEKNERVALWKFWR